MADIFNEIDEDLRRERLGKIWSRFGSYIIGLAVLIVLGVGAWRGYEWWQTREAAASGARFAAALKLSDEGKHTEAQAAFAEIAKDGTSGYRILARFRAATELAYTDKAAAVAAYDALANENGVDPLAREVARIRAGLLLVDTAPLADIEARMKPLDTLTGAFRNSAREILGLAQYRAGDYDAATKTFETLLADGELPPGMRQRAELMRTLGRRRRPAGYEHRARAAGAERAGAAGADRPRAAAGLRDADLARCFADSRGIAGAAGPGCARGARRAGGCRAGARTCGARAGSRCAGRARGDRSGARLRRRPPRPRRPNPAPAPAEPTPPASAAPAPAPDAAPPAEPAPAPAAPQ